MSAIPADEAAEQKALDGAGEGFILYRSRHYSVIYDTSEEAVKQFSGAIERTYRSCVNYVIKLDFSATVPNKKLIIYYFEHHPRYSDYSVTLGMGPRPQNQPGFYIPDLNVSLFYNFRNQGGLKKAREQSDQKISKLRDKLRHSVNPSVRRRIMADIKLLRSQTNYQEKQGIAISEITVQHEVSHQVLWNIGFHNPKLFLANPRWFAEGTAMMFEPISTGKTANFGATNWDRLRDFRVMQQQGVLIPLRNFISSHIFFGSKTISLAYPEAWALVHYINRKKRSDLKKYIKIINDRPADYRTTPDQEIKDFETAFGKIDKRWEQKWLQWIKRIK